MTSQAPKKIKKNHQFDIAIRDSSGEIYKKSITTEDEDITIGITHTRSIEYTEYSILPENELLKLSEVDFFSRYNGKTYFDKELDDYFLKALIRNKCGFSIKTDSLFDIPSVVKKVEKMMNDCSNTSRVYTRNRSFILAVAALTQLFIAHNLTKSMMILSVVAAAFLVHNMFTFKPDFYIGKEHILKKVNITYKKHRKNIWEFLEF